jgi:hypothetical protein
MKLFKRTDPPTQAQVPTLLDRRKQSHLEQLVAMGYEVLSTDRAGLVRHRSEKTTFTILDAVEREGLADWR